MNFLTQGWHRLVAPPSLATSLYRETSLFVNPEASLFLNSVRICICTIYLNLAIGHWHLKTQVPKLRKNLVRDIQSALILAKNEPFVTKTNFVASNNTCKFKYTLFKLMSIQIHVNSNSCQFKLVTIQTHRATFVLLTLLILVRRILVKAYICIVGNRGKIKKIPK